MDACASQPLPSADNALPGSGVAAEGGTVLVITGMHRSGTSVVASALASAGLAIGERLMDAGPGNPVGHFEDLDFVELHARILRANGLGGEGYTTYASLRVPPALESVARSLIASRRDSHKTWGWKDPRTTLFLDFWLSRLPEARFLLLIRRPWEVVDSLYRRGDDSFQLHPAFAIDVWTAYNRRIRDFFLAHRDRCLLLDSGRAVADCPGLVVAVRDVLGVAIGEAAAVAKPELFHEADHSRRRDLLGALRPEAIDLYEELLALAWPTGEARAQPVDGTIALELAMAEWARASRAEAAVVHLRNQVDSVSAERDRVRVECEHLRALESERLHEMVEASNAEPVVKQQAPQRKTVPQRIARESRRLYRKACDCVQRMRPPGDGRESGDPPNPAEAA